MVKATRMSAVLLGLVALGMVGSSVPVFAEVQNVKVGGDITVRSFWHKNLNLSRGNTESVVNGDFLSETTGVNINADLTENVSASIRLVNEADWARNFDAASTRSDVAVSQSYVTLKDLFYTPLTVRIGRQPIVWGRGFVLGSTLIPGVLGRGDDLHAAISANEFTDFTGFDAFRATLDLSGAAGLGVPLTVDGVYAKLNEGTVQGGDDVNLLGVNIGTHFDAMSSEVETYFLNKRDKGNSTTLSSFNKPGSISTLGVRGSAKPVEGAYAYGELAYQFGQRGLDAANILQSGDAQQAWAFDLGVDYTAKGIPMTPKIGGEWVFWSGKDSKSCAPGTTTTSYCGGVGGWDPIARGYFTTALREFQTASGVAGFYANSQNGTTTAATNQNQFALYGSLKPLEDLTIAPRLTWFYLADGIRPIGADGTAQTKKRSYAGVEWDTQVTYNYTDDVQFGLIYAIFSPGDVYRTPNDANAQELISSVSVKF